MLFGGSKWQVVAAFLMCLTVALGNAGPDCSPCGVFSQCIPEHGGYGNMQMQCANRSIYIQFSCCNDPGYLTGCVGTCSGWWMTCACFDEVNQVFRSYEIYCCSCDENCMS
jgi:hypothetical protein